MIISLNWLKKFTDIDMPIDNLATLIGARLVEIEKVTHIGEKYKDAVIVKVIECEPLENTDHLNLLKIDDIGFVYDIERGKDSLIQVVCGAPNVKAGQLVVWLPPKSIVPQTFGSAEPFALESKKIRGVISNGMIASSRELGLTDEHEGILVLGGDAKPGKSFAKTYELDDYLLDIENKSLTHRPDCFGIIGFAREVAAITGKAFVTPEWLTRHLSEFNAKQPQEVKLDVVIDNFELSARYLAVVMSGADSNKQSPLQIQTYLSRVGVRPINAVVDVTNYLMMLTGQPLHAFDYDKVVAITGGKAEIHVRAGHDGEVLELLDGREIKLTTEDIVIAAGETVIGLAGAMGGANTAIDENTKRIIIESATFNLYNLRSTQMRHGIFSEAITRFTKGQSAELTAPVLSAAIHLMGEWSGAKCISQVAEAYPDKNEQSVIELTANIVNSALGSKFTYEEIISTLHNAEFFVEQAKPDIMRVSAPYWRADIHIVEDIIEEIGRLNGFDNINPTLPSRDFVAVRSQDYDIFRSKVRKTLVRAGANEVLTYSFIHGNVLQKAGQKIENSYRITNSISPNLQYYRQTLTPSLLELVHLNIKQGYDNFALFEVNKSHKKSDGLTDEDVPKESDMIALVVADKNKQVGAPYYQAKRIFGYLCETFGLDLDYQTIALDQNDALNAPFEHRRSANIIDKVSGAVVGVVGEYRKSVIREFKLSEYTAGFEINIRALFDATLRLGSGYSPLSRYPASERDICFQVDREVTYSQIISAAKSVLASVELENNISPVDIYQPSSGNTKNITIRIKLTARDHTLTSEEVNKVTDTIIESVTSKTRATVI